MSSNRSTSPSNKVKPSEPIPIATSAFRGARGRSGSMSSSSSGSASSPSELQTPISGPMSSQPGVMPSPSSSPILSYFLAQSPKGPAPSTFPFRKFSGSAVASPVFEEGEPKELPAATHARRASTVVAGRFAQQPQTTAIPEPHMERGTGLLRRLSLSSAAFTKPSEGRPHSPPGVPPNSAVSPIQKNLPFSRDNKPRRAATISTDAPKPRRAPSPMGERILKGHFDGFN